MTSVEALLDAMVRTIKPILREVLTPNGCIGATRIALDALNYFVAYQGYELDLYPLAVKVMIWNPTLAGRIEKEKRFPNSLEERNEWMNEDGAWGIAVGVSEDPDAQFGVDWDMHTWNGHLVLIVNGVLIDLTLDQASRPERNINIPEYVVADCRDEAEFLDGVDYLGLTINECYVIYDGFPSDKSYEDSPNWTGSKKLVHTTGRVIRAMKKFLKQKEGQSDGENNF